jgi:hypothetical protein
MASGKVRSVSVVFQAFTDKFEKKVDGASNKMKGFGKKVLAGVGGFIAARSAVNAFSQSFDDLDRIAKLSDRLQINPEFLRGLDLAATQTGTTFSSVEKGIQKMARTVGEARSGMGEGVTAFKELGIAVEDFEGLSVGDQFQRIADLIAGIEDPAQKIAASNRIFGRSGQELINLLNQGSEGLEKFRKEADELGGPLSREDLERVEMANDAIDKMGRAWDGIIQQLSVELAPIVQSIADMFTEMNKIIRGIGNTWTEISQGLEADLLEFFLISGQLTQEEYEDALALVIPDEPRRDPAPAVTESFKGVEVKAKISNIKTFVEELSAGSSAAFRALNPTQQVDTQKQMVAEQQQANKTLRSIDEKIGNQEASNVVEIR